MKLREFLIYALIILGLLLGIFWLLRINSSGLNGSVGNKKTLTVVDSGKQGRQVVSNISGQQEKILNNYWGIVEQWDSKTGKLILNQDEKKVEYLITPGKTRVEIGKSQNKFRDTTLYIIDKFKQPMHWQQAFCPGDSVSLLVDPKSKEVDWIMDNGLRACGFKEAIK